MKVAMKSGSKYITKFGGHWRVGGKPWKWVKANAKKLKGVVVKPHKAIVMFDDVNLKLLPAHVEAVAAYVDGKYKNFDAVKAKYPHVPVLSIAVFASNDADCLDVEKGDATIHESVAWVMRQHARGVKIPVVYCSVSWAPALIAAMSAHGFKLNKHYKIWTAHYSFVQHRCTKACDSRLGRFFKAAATQWTDKAHNESLDESECAWDFFPVK